MQLKQYQVETLSVLRHFLEEASIAGPRNAYAAITSTSEQSCRLGRYRGEYKPLEGLPQVPYVCLRLPTGGGKTILGAYGIEIVRDAWIGKEYPIVLWLVPSNTIRQQTVEALCNTRHAYRQAMDASFEGRVRVFDIADFALIRPQDIADNCCVIVGTIQTLRVDKTEGRKVYAHHEDLEPHFSAIRADMPGLERLEGGGIKYSFANLLHIHRPLMIVDEAHNAVTGLTREMQTRVNPSAVIEFSATPRTNSNILHSVTAQELKSAEMIKLPIMLAEHDTWQSAVSRAVADRAALAKEAATEADYIRPIVLFQAQSKDQEVTHDVLRKHLIDAEQVDEKHIAIVTGGQRELDGIDLFDPKCPIEYVITVEALKEGWDCSFAYVFCSVARIQSATDVEQLLGRVLRMPYAKRRKAAALNRAYAHVSETRFGAAAQTLTDKLIDMGFEEEEAQQAVVVQTEFSTGSLFGSSQRATQQFNHTMTVPSDALEILSGTPGVSVRDVGNGSIELRISGQIDAQLEKTIAAVLPPSEQTSFSLAVQKFRVDNKQLVSPSESGLPFVVPRLMTWVQGSLEFADTDILMEYTDWRLTDHPARMSENEFNITETASSFQIDLDGQRVAYQFISEAEQLVLDVPAEGWTPENLTLWLDRQLRQPDIVQTQMLRWLRDCIGHLLSNRKISMTALMRTKFVLARKLRDRINAARQSERTKTYQRYLFAPESKVEVSFDKGFSFDDKMYAEEGILLYRGRFKFEKHFLGSDRVPAFDGNETGEEYQCAQALERLPNVKYWLRNIARHPSSFWLPTSTDKFYPDFIAELTDGRRLVVEYKGALTADGADTSEKRTIGALWEKSSSGKGAFVVVEKEIAGKDMHAQLVAKIGS